MIAVREVLDYSNTGRAIIVCLIALAGLAVRYLLDPDPATDRTRDDGVLTRNRAPARVSNMGERPEKEFSHVSTGWSHGYPADLIGRMPWSSSSC